MIDTHAHLDSEQFMMDIDNVIVTAKQNEIDTIIVPAIDMSNFDKVIELTDLYNNIFCALGVHPHEADSFGENTKNRIYQLVESNDKIVAIGEIGLDYYYNFSTPEVQKKVLKQQLQIAKDLKKPVILHNRGSDEDLIEILEANQDGNLKGVLHCFSGDTNFLRKVMDLGMYVSFTGNITFNKFNNIDTIKEVDNDRFLLETDSPYMTPVPHRGKRNEPKFLNLIAKKIAEIKEIEYKEVKNMTNSNAKRFFNLAILFILFYGMTSFLYSQPRNVDNNYDEEYYEEEEDFYNPYKKTLGIGFFVGTNTIVETYKTLKPINYQVDDDISHSGIIAFGGTIQYSPLDIIILSATYNYSKNDKLVKAHPDSKLLTPNIHQQLEFSSNFIINPNSRINFFGILGFSYILNRYADLSLEPDYQRYENNPGINTGIGFYINFPIKGAGNFALQAEWKINFMLGETHFNNDTRPYPLEYGVGIPVSVTTFFSIPRVNILWFPEFLFEN